MNENKVVLLFSGGMDSTVSASMLLAEGLDVIAVGVDYGQRHVIELEYAEAMASRLNIEFKRINARTMQSMFSYGNELVEGQDKNKQQGAQGVTTIVPNRNMFLLALAGSLAMSNNAKNVAIGFNKDDARDYPDCREVFAKAMSNALESVGIKLLLPTIKMSKSEIVNFSKSLGLQEDSMYSCYAGTVPQCGTCGACVLRKSVESNDSR